MRCIKRNYIVFFNVESVSEPASWNLCDRIASCCLSAIGSELQSLSQQHVIDLFILKEFKTANMKNDLLFIQ